MYEVYRNKIRKSKEANKTKKTNNGLLTKDTKKFSLTSKMTNKISLKKFAPSEEETTDPLAAIV